jgi:hypothetical protein
MFYLKGVLFAYCTKNCHKVPGVTRLFSSSMHINIDGRRFEPVQVLQTITVDGPFFFPIKSIIAPTNIF